MDGEEHEVRYGPGVRHAVGWLRWAHVRVLSSTDWSSQSKAELLTFLFPMLVYIQSSPTRLSFLFLGPWATE